MNQRFSPQTHAQHGVRLIVAVFFVLICFSLLVLRLVWLQVWHHDDYTTLAENNRITVIPTTPSRGLIKDRNGVILAENYSAFTLEITPANITGSMDDLINQISQIIEITAKEKRRFQKALIEEKTLASIALKTLLTDVEVAKITAHKYRLNGVEVKARLFRRYPLGESSSHVIGYLGRLSQKDQEKLEKISEENDKSANYDPRKELANYQGTQYIGKLGLEQSYEHALHGLTGAQKVEVNSAGRALRVLSNEPATPGENLITSIDAKLQYLVEQMYGERRGAFVAIEPSSGQVLSFVSKPNFDPNLFVDGIDAENWQALNEHPHKPLLNRALKGLYPPGSTYKPYMSLAALELGARTANYAISDPGYFIYGNHKFMDDKVGGHGMVNMYKSIVHSCNTYYYTLAAQMGVDKIHDFMKPFGFGQITGIDLYGEKQGILPSKAWKEKAYKNPLQKKWYDGETVSIGIGQGYNSFSMLQLSHALSILANHGKVIPPRIAYAVEDPRSKTQKKLEIKPTQTLNFKAEHLATVIKGMQGVNLEGTSSGSFRNAPYESAGKTGTAQVFTLARGQKYVASRVDADLRDHALFIVFAPIKNPQIAIGMIVENGGFGAQAAAPIARAAIDYYLNKQVPADLNLDLKYVQSTITSPLAHLIKAAQTDQINHQQNKQNPQENMTANQVAIKPTSDVPLEQNASSTFISTEPPHLIELTQAALKNPNPNPNQNTNQNTNPNSQKNQVKQI